MSTRPKGRIYLDPLNGHFTVGTWQELAEEQITPVEGMKLQFWSGDGDSSGNPDNLLFEGTIHYKPDENRWSVHIDEASYHHESDGNKTK